MIGVVDVGGGMRGVYGAGVFDYCLDNEIYFDVCVGVSAGSANCMSYMARAKGRNLRFYADYSHRRQYMGFSRRITHGSFLNMDYIYGELCRLDGEDPLDFQAVLDSGTKFAVVVTDAQSGLPVYYTLEDMEQDDYAPIKASSSIPVVNKPYPVHGRLGFDGGLSDPIPFKKAFEMGCDKVVVILTRPKEFRRSSLKDMPMAAITKRSWPNAGDAFFKRAEVYNTQLNEARRLENQGKLLIVSPADIGEMTTLTTDRSAVTHLYANGFADASKIKDFVNA